MREFNLFSQLGIGMFSQAVDRQGGGLGRERTMAQTVDHRAEGSPARRVEQPGVSADALPGLRQTDHTGQRSLSLREAGSSPVPNPGDSGGSPPWERMH